MFKKWKEKKKKERQEETRQIATAIIVEALRDLRERTEKKEEERMLSVTKFKINTDEVISHTDIKEVIRILSNHMTFLLNSDQMTRTNMKYLKKHE
jgi:hypothetical protein